MDWEIRRTPCSCLLAPAGAAELAPASPASCSCLLAPVGAVTTTLGTAWIELPLFFVLFSFLLRLTSRRVCLSPALTKFSVSGQTFNWKLLQRDFREVIFFFFPPNFIPLALFSPWYFKKMYRSWYYLCYTRVCGVCNIQLNQLYSLWYLYML